MTPVDCIRECGLRIMGVITCLMQVSVRKCGQVVGEGGAPSSRREYNSTGNSETRVTRVGWGRAAPRNWGWAAGRLRICTTVRHRRLHLYLPCRTDCNPRQPFSVFLLPAPIFNSGLHMQRSQWRTPCQLLVTSIRGVHFKCGARCDST